MDKRKHCDVENVGQGRLLFAQILPASGKGGWKHLLCLFFSKDSHLMALCLVHTDISGAGMLRLPECLSDVNQRENPLKSFGNSEREEATDILREGRSGWSPFLELAKRGRCQGP